MLVLVTGCVFLKSSDRVSVFAGCGTNESPERHELA